MDPLLAWIEAHRREDWASAATRAGYEAVYGPIPAVGGRSADTQWRSAVSRAFHRERVVNALEEGYSTQTVGSVLSGIVRYSEEYVIRVRVTGTDAMGRRASVIVDVGVDRSDDLNELWRLAHEAIEGNPSSAGLQIDDLEVAAGSYAV